jgi:hypothetical protein
VSIAQPGCSVTVPWMRPLGAGCPVWSSLTTSGSRSGPSPTPRWNDRRWSGRGKHVGTVAFAVRRQIHDGPTSGDRRRPRDAAAPADGVHELTRQAQPTAGPARAAPPSRSRDRVARPRHGPAATRREAASRRGQPGSFGPPWGAYPPRLGGPAPLGHGRPVGGRYRQDRSVSVEIDRFLVGRLVGCRRLSRG